MLELLRRCIEFDEPDAWGDLYVLVEETVAFPVRCVLRRLVVDQNETEAVVLELFEHLYLNGIKLRTCRARTEAGFRAWLRPVAANFALDWVERRGRAIVREKAALWRATLPDRSGPDERQLQAWLDELRTKMTPRDFERVLKLAKLSTVETPIADCTRRKWIVRLMNKYPDLFGEATPS
jgi:hypothetical protein